MKIITTLTLYKQKIRVQITIILNFNCLKNCKNIKTFSRKKKIKRLLFYKNYNHVIDIITKLLFNSLYNLFNIKLIILKNYLNDILIKD